MKLIICNIERFYIEHIEPRENENVWNENGLWLSISIQLSSSLKCSQGDPYNDSILWNSMLYLQKGLAYSYIFKCLISKSFYSKLNVSLNDWFVHLNYKVNLGALGCLRLNWWAITGGDFFFLWYSLEWGGEAAEYWITRDVASGNSFFWLETSLFSPVFKLLILGDLCCTDPNIAWYNYTLTSHEVHVQHGIHIDSISLYFWWFIIIWNFVCTSLCILVFHLIGFSNSSLIQIGEGEVHIKKIILCHRWERRVLGFQGGSCPDGRRSQSCSRHL